MKRCSVITTGQLACDHIAALEGLQGAVTIDRRCADIPELIAAAAYARADAALLIGDTEQLTDSVLERLRQAGLAIVVISEVSAERERLTALGATCHSDDVAPETLAESLQNRPTNTGVQNSEDPQLKAFAAAPRLADDHHAAEPESDDVPGGGITVIWGVPGAPGRTTIAVNLAAELALTGATVLLVDADTYAASAAIHLGLLEESAGLAQACRAAEHGTLEEKRLQQATITLETKGVRWQVLTGLPRPDRWAEIRARAMEKVLTLARNTYQHVVVDVAAPIEHQEHLSFDTHAPQRNAATRSCLAAADKVIAVGGADPVGFSRLIRAVEDYPRSLPEAATPTVVVNRLRKSVIGRSPRHQLDDAWRRFSPGGELSAFLPEDSTACDSALRQGQVLAEAAPESLLRRGIAALAQIDLSAGTTGWAWTANRMRRRRRQKVG